MAGELPQTALPGKSALGVRYVFHRILPVARSSAAMLPRKLQQM
jgi:hypothetical protein